MLRHFAGARPTDAAESSDESSESEEDGKVDKVKRFDSSTVQVAVSGRVRRRPIIEAKVLTSNDDEGNQEKPPRKGRKRITPTVISTGRADVNSEQKPLSEAKASREDTPKISPERAQTNDLPSFVSVTKKNASLEEDALPDLRVEDDAGSGPSSESEEYSTSSSESETPSKSAGERADQDYEVQELPTAPLAPVYVPSFVRANEERAAKDVRDKRKIEAYKRKREACNRVVQAAKHEVEETEYDLKHVDMEKFPDDTDRPEDFDEEFALWRVRELKRVMRDRGMSVDDDESEEENEESVEKPEPKKSETGERTFKVGVFFAEKNADGSYVQSIYNRDFRGQDEPESVEIRKKSMLARGVRM